MASFTTLFLFAFFFATPLLTRGRLFSDNTHSLSYHGGPILHGPLSLHILWYGSFSPSQRSIIADFISSFYTSSDSLSSPSIPLWWKTIALYSTSPFLSSSPPSPQLLLGLQASISDPSLSHGFSLNKTTLPKVLQDALSYGLLPTSPKSIYFILTSQNVVVEDFCMGTCGLHAHKEMKVKTGRSSTSSSTSSSKSKLQKVAYIWVGNAARQCPGECAWPLAKVAYGPRGVPPLVAPNGDVGVEGMVINMATLLAGTVTNPFNTGFFMGDARVPVEAGSACTGLFGEGAFSGFPGRLLVSNYTGASFNVHGINNRTFLLPALWNPTISKCITLP